MTFRQWLALANLGRHALKLGLHHFLDVNELPAGFGKGLLGMMQTIFPPPAAHHADKLCATVESLGPVYIKLGQLLSTRPDLLPAASRSSTGEATRPSGTHSGFFSYRRRERTSGAAVSGGI
jgi:hypothetical protein